MCLTGGVVSVLADGVGGDLCRRETEEAETAATAAAAECGSPGADTPPY